MNKEAESNGSSQLNAVEEFAYRLQEILFCTASLSSLREKHLIIMPDTYSYNNTKYSVFIHLHLVLGMLGRMTATKLDDFSTDQVLGSAIGLK